MEPTVSALKRQENRQEAQDLLDKVYKYVKPIMRKRGYKVAYLSEFYPKNSRLLGINVNHGLRINLRLRQPYDKNCFLPFESVLDTMLHELTHNVFGPHDRKFFALYEELRDEMQTMILKGFRGDLFIGNGRRLGPINGPSPLRTGPMRTAGLGATGPLRGKGYRLGGIRPGGRRSAKAMAAEAAERRRIADRVCAQDVPFEDLGCEEISAEEFYHPRSAASRSSAPAASASASKSAASASTVIDLVEPDSVSKIKPKEVIDLT